MPHLTGGGDCHSPVRSGGDLVALEGLNLLELLAACSRYGVFKEGDQLVFRRRLADYQARPSPSCARSREEDERRRWLGTVGAEWLRVPFSFVEHLPVLVMQHRIKCALLEGMCTPGILREDRWFRLGWVLVWVRYARKVVGTLRIIREDRLCHT